MATPDEFAAACKENARALRRFPKELRRTLGQRGKAEVAEPLAADIRTAWSGPHAAVLSAATKTRVSADPQIVVGGARRVVSGGASARQLVFGDDFGGGNRVSAVAATSRNKAHRRRTTKQFPRKGQGSIYGTVHRTLDKTFERWANVIDETIREVFDRG